MNRRVTCAILITFILVVGIGQNAETASATAGNAHFGDDIQVLQLADEQILWQSYVSPSGSFVFAKGFLYDWLVDKHTIGMSMVHGASHYLWDLREPLPHPIQIQSVPVDYTNRDDMLAGTSVAFSPDERYLALLSGFGFQVFRLPDLELVKFVPEINRYSYGLAWSHDGTWLGGNVNDEIIIWNSLTDEMITNTVLQPDLYKVRELIYTEAGWFSVLRSKTSNYPNGMATCTPQLETCTTYALPTEAGSPFIAPDGQFILLNLSLSNIQPEYGLQIWERQPDGHYLEDDTIIPHESFIYGFSPNGRYLYSYIDPSSEFGIYDAETLDLTFTLPGFLGGETWLPDSQHVVAVSHQNKLDLTFYLYEIGNDEPLDTLNLLDHLDPAETPESLSMEIREISQDGRTVLVDLGWATLVIPIEYE